MTQKIDPQPVVKPAPDLDIMRQEGVAPVVHSVPVVVEGIAYNVSLPSKRANMTNVVVDTLVNIPIPNELIPADPRIRRCWITCTATAGSVVVGTLEEVRTSTGPKGFPLPQNVPMAWEGFDKPLYGVATAAGPFTVALRFEYWAD